MKFEEFKIKLQDRVTDYNIKLTNEDIERFYNYMNILLEWNEKINLTAITEPDEIIDKHFVDSLTINKYIKGDEKIVDIGTGAGFPGVPIKISNPNTQIVLLDSLNKRITFLEELIKKIKLKNIIAIHSRAEELSRNNQHREQYDICVSRAVSNMQILVEYMLPYIKKDGIAICMKGSNIEELKSSYDAIKKLGGEIEKIEEINLPKTDIKRNIIIIRKKKETPSQYPRSFAKISKNPL